MATESKPKAPTPVERVAELETQLAKANELLGTATQGLADSAAKFQKSETDLTARTDELLAERRAHSETKLAHQKAESDFTTEKAAHDALKADFQSKVQVEAAKIAANNGHAAAPAAPAASPGAVADAPDKTKMSASELLANGFKADLKR